MRHIPKNKLRRDGETDAVLGILPQAFELRPAIPPRAAETYLSCWCVDAFGNNHPGDLFRCIRNARNKRKPKPKDAFAIALVGVLREQCVSFGVTIKVTHEPSSGDPGYATIRDYENNDLALREAIAAGAWSFLIMNADVPIELVPKL